MIKSNDMMSVSDVQEMMGIPLLARLPPTWLPSRCAPSAPRRGR